jgi:hypothetical protein
MTKKHHAFLIERLDNTEILLYMNEIFTSTSYNRGDLVIYSWNRHNATELRCGPHVYKFPHIRMLGIVLSSRVYYVGQEDTVHEQTLLSILNLGEFYSTALLLPDHVTQTFQGRETAAASHRMDLYRYHNISTHFPRKHMVLTDLDVICMHKSLHYYLQKQSSTAQRYPLPTKITVTATICVRPSQIEYSLTSSLNQMDQIHRAYKLWRSLQLWKNYSDRVGYIQTTNAILVQQHIRRFLKKNTLQQLGLRKKWWTIHKHFPYVTQESMNWVHAYRVEGTNVFLPTKALANTWFSLMKHSIFNISTVAKRSGDQRIQEAWFRWRTSIQKQQDEIQLMRGEEIYSYVFSMSSKSSLNSSNLNNSTGSSSLIVSK